MEAEDFIKLIEQGRLDKISPNALDLIAKKYREMELEVKEFKSQNSITKYDIECKICGMPFDDKEDLYEHYDDIHNQGNH